MWIALETFVGDACCVTTATLVSSGGVTGNGWALVFLLTADIPSQYS
jgi:hypothetical protein